MATVPPNSAPRPPKLLAKPTFLARVLEEKLRGFASKSVGHLEASSFTSAGSGLAVAVPTLT